MASDLNLHCFSMSHKNGYKPWFKPLFFCFYITFSYLVAIYHSTPLYSNRHVLVTLARAFWRKVKMPNFILVPYRFARSCLPSVRLSTRHSGFESGQYLLYHLHLGLAECRVRDFLDFDR